MSEVRPTLDLSRDVGFFLSSLDDEEEKTEVLGDLQAVLAKGQKTFASYDAFSEAVSPSLYESYFGSPVLTQARRFFDGVVSIHQDGGDVLYEMGTPGAGSAAVSAYVFVDYRTDSQAAMETVLPDGISHYTGDFKFTDYAILSSSEIKATALSRVAEAYRGNVATWIAASLPHGFSGADVKAAAMLFDGMAAEDLKRIADTQEKNGVSDKDVFLAVKEFADLQPFQTAEAVDWYFSEELRWMDNHEALPPALKERNRRDKMGVIRESFDESRVVQREDKMRSYFEHHRSDYREHRRIATEYLKKTGLDKKCVGANVDTARVVDMVMLIIIIESQGNAKASNGSFKGLMQLGPDKFKEYGGGSTNYFNPEVNIRTGINYLLKYCFGQSRNPNRDYSRAFINYNMGAGAAGSYRCGERTLDESEAKPYIRDYIMYERLKAQYFPQNVIYGRY